MSPHQEQEAEVRERMEAYRAAFESMSVDGVLSFYHVPGYILGPSFHLPMSSQEHVKAFLQKSFTQMRAENFARSRFGEMHIHMLNPIAALVSTVWERVDNDGKVLLRSAVTYQLTKHTGEWMILSGVMHDQRTVIRRGSARAPEA